MLSAERMRKVTVAFPKRFERQVISELHRLKALHILSHSRDDFDIGSPFAAASAISEQLVKVRSIITSTGLSGDVELDNGFRAVGVKSFSQLSGQIRKLHDEVASLIERKKQAESAISGLDSVMLVLSELEKLGLPLEAFSEYSSISFFVGSVDSPESVKHEIAAVTEKSEVYLSPEQKSGVIAVFVEKPKAKDISSVLSSHKFSELGLSAVSGMKGMPSDAIKSVVKRREKLTALQAGCLARLSGIAGKWHDFLLLSEQFLAIELEKAEAPLMFASSENVLVVSGWLPSGSMARAVEAITKAAKGKVSIDMALPSHDDNVPVKLSNPRPFAPFEFFMRLYALPKYSEIDPTVFMFFTFPLFFGIILGDVGYGLVTLLLLYLIAKRFPKSASLVKVITPAAVSSVLFGFIFGEFFGFEELFGFEIPHLISRFHQVNEMLVISIIIGILHLNLGIFLGFVNELHHGLKKAVLSKLSWVVLEIGVAVFVASKLSILPVSQYVGASIATLAVAMLYMGEGFLGLLELPGFASNVLSYSRLMAVGLASVGLAIVVNSVSGQLFEAGGLLPVLAVLVAFIGHSINIALGILGGFLQSLRLHYVEFFTKFYQGGATPFKPFGEKL